MITDTEGIILRQTKIANGRRMIVLFSRKFGKISAGSNINEKGRSKSALAMRPFTYGRYELYRKGRFYNINGAETLKSYYSIGEDVDKYMSASYCLELADKLLAEEQSAEGLFDLTVEVLALLEKRNQRYDTPVLAYELKALKQLGYMPQLDKCVKCGKEGDPAAFSVSDGGILCTDCRKYTEKSDNDSLIYDINFVIVNIMKFLLDNPLESLEKLALEEDKATVVRTVIREYIRYHLDIDSLKSEDLIEMPTRR